MLRKNLHNIIEKCRQISGDDLEIIITTNAFLLNRQLDDLIKAGLSRINVSLHSLNPDTYNKITGVKANLEEIKQAILKAKKENIKVKINSTIIKGINDKEITEIAKFSFDNDIIPRFLRLETYGPVKDWFKEDNIMQPNEIIEIMNNNFGTFKVDTKTRGNGITRYFINEKNQVFGITANVYEDLCRECNRFRMTTNGFIKVCNIKPINLRESIDDEEKLKETLLKLGDILEKNQNREEPRVCLHNADYNFRWSNVI